MSDIAGRIDKLSPTKRALLIERLRQSQKREAIITPRADRDAFPLSFAQRRMWFLHQLDPESAAYNMPALLRLRGRLNIGALHSSLQEILRRHDALRARFVTIRGQPEQVIEALDVVPLPLIALDHLPADEREMALERLVQEEARRPFDLGRAPLLRTHLLRLSSDEHALILVAHHIAADGWSINILLRELEALYTAFAEGKPSPLAPLALQYADYAAWQRMHLEERDVTGDGAPLSRRERQLAFWRAHLSDVPALELPTDHPRRLTQHVAGRQFAFALPDDAMAVLRTLAAQEGATPFMALLALFETLLARYSEQDLFAVGIPVAGRTHAELEPLVGCFVNTLALRAAALRPAVAAPSRAPTRHTISGCGAVPRPLESARDRRSCRGHWRCGIPADRTARRHRAARQCDPDGDEPGGMAAGASQRSGQFRWLRHAGGADDHRQWLADRGSGAWLVWRCAACRSLPADAAAPQWKRHGAARRGVDGMGRDDGPRLYGGNAPFRHCRVCAFGLGVWRRRLCWRLGRNCAAPASVGVDGVKLTLLPSNQCLRGRR